MNSYLLLILSIGLLLRLYKLDIPLLEFYPTRQVQTAEITRNLYNRGFNILKPEVGYFGPEYVPFLFEFPLYNFVVASIYLLTGPIEIVGRLVSIAGWAIAAIFLYKFTLFLVNKTAALASVFFYTFSPLSILISRSFQPDQWMLTCSLGAIFFMLRWKQDMKILDFYISAIFLSLSMLLKIHPAVFTLFPLGYLLLNSRSRLHIFPKVAYAAVVILPSALWFLYSTSFRNITDSSRAGFSLANWFGLEIFLNPKYYSNIFGFEYNLVLLPLGLILFLIGLTIRVNKRQFFLYFWLGSIILYFLLFNKLMMTHEYYHLPILPIASVFMGIAFKKIYTTFGQTIIRKEWLIVALSVLVLILMLPPTLSRAYKPIERFKYVVEAGEAVQRLTTSGEPIIGSMDAGPSLVYYSDRNGWGFEVNRINNANELAFYGVKDARIKDPLEELEDLRQKGAVIFASANKNQFYTNQDFKNYMYSHYEILEETENYIIFSLRNIKS